MEILPSYAPAYQKYMGTRRLYERSLWGMMAAQARATEAARDIARQRSQAEPMMDMRAGLYAFKANAITLRSTHEATGSLLNAVA